MNNFDFETIEFFSVCGFMSLWFWIVFGLFKFCEWFDKRKQFHDALLKRVDELERSNKVD